MRTDALDLGSESFADVFQEDFESGSPVERDDHVALRVRHRVLRTDRGTALSETRRDDHRVGERDAGQPAFHHAIGDLEVLLARARESPEQKAAFHFLRELRDDLRRLGVVGIDVHERECGLRLSALQIEAANVPFAGDPRKNLERAWLEIAHHRSHGRLVEILVARRADADAHRADPVHDARRLAARRKHFAQMIREPVGRVEKAEIAVRPLELFSAASSNLAPVGAACVSVCELRHRRQAAGRAPSRETRGMLARSSGPHARRYNDGRHRARLIPTGHRDRNGDRPASDIETMANAFSFSVERGTDGLPAPDHR